MEGFCFYPRQVSSTPQKNPLFHDFLAGDSNFSGESPAESPVAYDCDSVSDCESSISSSSSCSLSSTRRRGGAFPEGLVDELDEGERVFEVIRQRFLTCLDETMREKTTVAKIYQRNWSGISAKAKLQSFQIHSRAMVEKHGGDGGAPNVKFAWFGSSRERIESILSHGFSHLELQGNSHGAVLLSPDHSPASSVENAIADENGQKHVLLCRVIMGKPESVQASPGQTHPSSDRFDSGVDDIDNPNKYIIWSTNMNVHILPEYVITFRPPPLRGCSRTMEDEMKTPMSPWISFPALIQVLGKFLQPNAISLFNKHHKDYKERRITRPELIRKVRQIAGDKLLVAVIKSCKGAKDLSFGPLRGRSANK